MSIRILVQDLNTGVMTDAQLVKSVIEPYYRDIKIVYFEKATDADKKEVAKLNIYIEHLDPNFSMQKGWFPAHRRWYIPNQEFIEYNDYSYMSCIDMILVKTRSLEKVLSKVFCNSVKYIGFTSPIGLINETVDRKLFVHIGSKHHFKNSIGVLEGWLDKWVKKSDMTLVIFKQQANFSDEYDRLINRMKGLRAKPVDRFRGIKVNMLNYENVWFQIDRIDRTEFEKIIGMAGYLIQPSVVEGFGHSINEGLGYTKLVITTDGAPMNELVDNNSGVLIECKRKTPTYLLFPKVDMATELGSRNYMWEFENVFGYEVDKKDIANAIGTAVGLTDVEYKRRTENGHRRFVEMKAGFQDMMKKLTEFVLSIDDAKIRFDKLVYPRGNAYYLTNDIMQQMSLVLKHEYNWDSIRLIELFVDNGIVVICGPPILLTKGKPTYFQSIPQLKDVIKMTDKNAVIVDKMLGNRNDKESDGVEMRTRIFDSRSMSGPTMMLDDWKGGSVKAIMLDMGGRELTALDGAKNVIKTDKPILIFDYNPIIIDGGPPDNIFEYCRSVGYDALVRYGTRFCLFHESQYKKQMKPSLVKFGIHYGFVEYKLKSTDPIHPQLYRDIGP
jgi:glycosyltransferase involved in cell wall biosynthesis